MTPGDIDHVDWTDLTSQVLDGIADAGEIEVELCADIEADIFDLDHDIKHGQADADTRRRRAELVRLREKGLLETSFPHLLPLAVRNLYG